MWDDGAVWRSRRTEALTITHLFSFLTSPDLPDCLTPVTREEGRPSPAVYTSCFLFPTLFEKREVTDHMWGATQVPVSARLNVPFMSERCSAKFFKKKSRRRLMWSVGKQKHKRMGSVYAPAEVRRLCRAASSRLSCKTFHWLGSWNTVPVLSAAVCRPNWAQSSQTNWWTWRIFSGGQCEKQRSGRGTDGIIRDLNVQRATRRDKRSE